MRRGLLVFNFLIFCLLIQFLWPEISFSDDSYMGGVGGTLKPQNSEDIVMQEEVVNITLSRKGAKVECVYVFHNTSSAQTVVMGFPGILGEEESPVKKFKAYVNGKPVKVEKKEISEEGDNQTYRIWYTHKVSFKAGETKVVKNTFLSPYSGVPVGTLPGTNESFVINYFEYILETGNTWKGKIGKVKINVKVTGDLTLNDLIAPADDWEGRYKKGDYAISPPGFKILEPDKIYWEFRNLEPTKKNNILICYYYTYPEYLRASSELRFNGYYYPARFVKDKNPRTAWSEGVSGSGINEYLFFDGKTWLSSVQDSGLELDSKINCSDYYRYYVITGVSILPGYARSERLFYMYNRPSKILLQFKDGFEEIRLRDQMKMQHFSFPPHDASWIKLMIGDVYKGTFSDDTFISEVSFDIHRLPGKVRFSVLSKREKLLLNNIGFIGFGGILILLMVAAIFYGKSLRSEIDK